MCWCFVVLLFCGGIVVCSVRVWGFGLIVGMELFFVRIWLFVVCCVVGIVVWLG